ncbi:MAG: orotidine-5'-phosphate decarboxylase [bacterium]|nr:orotidine-5'-phosphate decarboxylase [bacterium]
MLINNLKAQERLIVALDVESFQEAEDLVKELRSYCYFFKIGFSLFIRFGPDIVKMVQDLGGRVFLDLKLHDIPKTIERATRAVLDLKVTMFTLHTTGGRQMLRTASKILREVKEDCRPYSLGVTILTSMDEQNLKDLGISKNIDEAVLDLAKIAKEEGLKGVVASPLEVVKIRSYFNQDLVIVTPGIRLESSHDDQKRTNSPYEAITNGADFIVVGRPILESLDKIGTVEIFIREIEKGVRKR